jgi:transposase
MESTGVYWIPLYQILESRGLEVRLVNTRQVRTVPGRKTDVLDCQWLQKLHSHGLLSGSFRPADEVCVLRTFLRQRAHLVEDASRQVQLIQKALQQMNVLLHHVVSDITGVTGMAILRAIVAGERDPHQLAAYRDRRVKRSEAEIAEALTGDYRPEHLFCLEQALETYTYLLGQIEACDRQISAKLQEFDSRVDPESSPLPPPPSETPNLTQVSDLNPKETSKSRLKSGSAMTSEALYRWTGVDLTQIDGIGVQTAQVVLSEIGPDLSRFPTEKQFVSYLSLSPHNRISGGKLLPHKGRPSTSRVGQALRMAAMTLRKSSCALGAFFRRIQSRLGTPIAVHATARKLAILIYRMLTSGQNYVDPGQNYYDERYKEKVVKGLARRADQLGFGLVPHTPAPGAAPQVS